MKLISKAILYWRSGRPIPLDLEVDLMAAVYQERRTAEDN